MTEEATLPVPGLRQRHSQTVGTPREPWPARKIMDIQRPFSAYREVIIAIILRMGQYLPHKMRRLALAFAASQGFVAESTDNVRVLDLPVPDAVLDRLEASARERWAGAYRLETHTDGLPEELVEGYCRVSNLLNVDAPTGAVDFEAETLTPERYRGYLDLERRQGRRRLTTVALEEATGEVVAYTDLVLPSGAPTKTWQWGTLVDRAHRGHRLGMAVKVANLRELQSAHPERETVGTGNDATNSYMVGINEEMGFHVVEVARMCRKVLTDL